MEFVEPSKRHADMIIPEGAQTHISIDMLCGLVREKLRKEQTKEVKAGTSE
jgi:uridine kinase